MEKLLLIDGHSILSRAYYGIPHLSSSDGTPTNAVYGFLNIILKCIDEEKADYIAAAFDLDRKKLRRTALYPEYKGTRRPMPEDLLRQVPIMMDVLRAMNVPIYTLEGYEADDILGTIADRAGAEGMDVCIVSGDRDLLQLSSEHVRISIPKTSKGRTEVHNYFPDDVIREYGVTPREFIDMKALMGDSSDNVPGLPGIGEKTAGDIIRCYHSIESAYAHADELKPPRAKTAFTEHFDLAKLSKELVTIDTKVPIDVDPRAGRTGSIYTGEALAIIRELELRTIASRFADHVHVNANAADSSAASGGDLLRAGLDSMKVVTDPYVAGVIWRDAAREELISFSLIADAACAAVSVALSGERVYVLLSGEEYGAERLVKDLEQSLNTRIGAGLKSVTLDLKRELKSININKNKEIHDLSIALYLIDPGRNSYGYDLIARRYLGVNPETAEELVAKADIFDMLGMRSFEQITLFGTPAAKVSRDEGAREKALRYLTLSALVPRLGYAALMERLRTDGTSYLFEEVEIPLIYTLDSMEKLGIAVDREALAALADGFREEIGGIEHEITELAGESFNINSPKQLGHILFEKLGIKGSKKTKTGYSTSADVLEKIRDSHPIVPRILRYRAVSKLYSTYARGLSDFISADGRIHGSFNQTIAATGRLTSTEPNLQNIPVRTEEGKEIRRVFVPAEGMIFVDADFSQVELRILAALSGDETLIEAYDNNVDIHALTASMVFHTPIAEVTPAMRRSAKAVNFGIVYGISAFGLGEDLSIGRKEAAEYIERYFETYPKVKEYLDRTVAKAKEQGFVRTYFGRIRPIPELKSSNYAERSFGERIAMNSPIQGTAADIMKIAMNKAFDVLEERGLKSHIVLQVHDELLVETDPAEADEVREILSEAMEHAADIGVTLSVDINMGESWYDCH